MNRALARVTLTLLGLLSLLAAKPASAAETAVAPQAPAADAAATAAAAPAVPAGAEEPAAPVPAGHPAGAAADAGAAAPQDPQALAKALFDQIQQADTYDLTTIERLYLEVMEKAPETDQAQESYWRLSNLYLQAYDDPKYPEARALLERFLARYPDSEGVPLVKRRLAFVYEEMKDWPKTVEIYSELFAAPEVPAEALQEYGFSYAQALKNAGRVEEARVWYRRFLEAMQGQDDFRVRVAHEDLKALDGVGGGAPAPAASAGPDVPAAAAEPGGSTVGATAPAPAPVPEATAAQPAPAAPTPAAPTPAAAAPAREAAAPPTPVAPIPPAAASPAPEIAPAAVPAAAAAPAPGVAPGVERATQMQRDAAGLQGSGDYVGALQTYRQSLALRPDPEVAARVKKLEAYLKARGIDLPPAP
jgi:tetratricopeptide (TPR) repeat protein